MGSIIETMRFKHATVVTIFIANSAIRMRWTQAGDQSVPFVKIEFNSQTRCADTLDASIWATIKFGQAAGCY